MAGWLSRIDRRRKKNEPTEPAEPPSYDVLCRCGERSIGLRIRRYQQVICKECGEPLFVLPMNVYPEPPPPPPSERRAAPPPTLDDPSEPDIAAALAEDAAALRERREEEANADGDLDILTELSVESRKSTRKPPPPREPRARKKESPKKKARSEKANPAAGQESTPDRRGETASPQPEQNKDSPTKPPPKRKNQLLLRVPLRERVRNAITPFRLVVVSILAMVLATAAWQVHKNNVETSRIRFDSLRKQALAKLEEGAFVDAEMLLDDAVAAADISGRDDAVANRIRRLQLETNVINNLPSISLHEALGRAGQAARPDMASVLKEQLGESWIVLDTYVAPEGEVDGEVAYIAEIPLLVGKVMAEAHIRGSELDRLKLSSAGHQVIFAARVAACDLRAGRNGFDTLVIQLDPESVRLWTDPELLTAVGMLDPEDTDTSARLAGQAGLFGVK